jgi:hypothetical protein
MHTSKIELMGCGSLPRTVNLKGTPDLTAGQAKQISKMRRAKLPGAIKNGSSKVKNVTAFLLESAFELPS